MKQIGVVIAVRDLLFGDQTCGTRRAFIPLARRIVSTVRAAVQSEDREMLKETLSWLDAYDIAPSQFGNLRERIRKHIT